MTPEKETITPRKWTFRPQADGSGYIYSGDDYREEEIGGYIDVVEVLPNTITLPRDVVERMRSSLEHVLLVIETMRNENRLDYQGYCLLFDVCDKALDQYDKAALKDGGV
jgi:hypothetical protein